MSKNYMPEVAKMLGVELGERFKLNDGTDMDFMLAENGVWMFNDGMQTVSDFVLGKMLRGDFKIIKKPWKPKNGDTCYYVHWNGSIGSFRFANDDEFTIAMFYMGNCFRAMTEAETHRDEIMAKFREVMD